MGLQPAPGGKARCAADGGRGPPAAEVCHEPPHQIVSESGAVDHLDDEAVRYCVECLRDVHRYGYCSARGLTLVEARDHPNRNGEHGRGGGVPRFDGVLGGKEDPLQYLHCRAEQ